MVKHLVIVVAVVGCGEVKSSTPDSRNIDAPILPVDAPPDADPCPAYAVPPGAIGLHSVFCTAALGFNSTATPPSMTLLCPDTGAAVPGTYGKILRPAAINQINGCPATTQTTRILAPAVNNAVTQTSTGNNLNVVAGSRFRVRVACAAGVANCSTTIQVTGRVAAGTPVMAIQGSRTIANEVVDIDVPMPAGLVGTTTNISLIMLAPSGANVADLLWESPSLGP